MINMISIKKNGYKLYLVLLILTLAFVFTIYLNYSFRLSNVKIEFLNPDSTLMQEDIAIRDYLHAQILGNSNTLLNFFLLNEKLITKLIRDEYQSVGNIDFDQKIYFNSLTDFGLGLYVVVVKNKEYFVGCVQDDKIDSFLVWSMLGNAEGEFYKEISQDECKSKTKLVKLILNPKSINYKDSDKKVEEPDSLSGMRVYTKEDFLVLKEILQYLQKNGFEVKNIYANELSLVEINLDNYILKINLKKMATDTIADFETISKTGKLAKYITEEKAKIEYIDLSFKDKVFYKLKNATKNDTMSSTTNAKEFLD